MRLGTVVLLAAVTASAVASFSFPEVTSVRVKRQQCRCLRLVNGGGMQCSCMQPLATNELGSGGLASQVSQAAGAPQASCQCIQIFISDSPTYRCLCDPRPPTPTVGVTIQTTVPIVTQPATTQTSTLPPTIITVPSTISTFPPITTPPTTTTTTVTMPPVTTLPPFSYPTNPPVTTTVPTVPTVPSTISTFPPITTPPTTVTMPPVTYTTAPTTFTTPPPITSPPLITPTSTFPPITTPPTTVTLPPVTFPVTIPTVTTASPLPTPGPSSSTTPGYEPPVTITVPPSQACQCIMIRINGPQNAQYQCSCPGVANPIPVSPGGTGTGVTGAPAIPSQNDAPTLPYPATGVTNGTSAGCFCLDGANPNLGCGCSCDCLTLTVTIPTGVCVCPQDDSGRVVTTPGQPSQPTPGYLNPVTPAPTAPVVPGQPQTLPPITPGHTYPVTYTPSPVTLPVVYPTGGQSGLPAQPVQPTQPNLQPITTTLAPIVQPGQPGATPSTGGTTTLPLTTTCILYPVNGGSTQQQQCTCMPQYEQCAQNVCCLSSRFRSQKNEILRAAADATGVQESTLDIFVDMFNKIKNRFSATA
ncbi:hypothetical protein PRIPAC_91215 [Pristionchus pacificus]|uniref:Uncharacterized protein n=1 Tax=Pristionchus pacificus TaxID=54126 RepID=A0A454Y0G8_PRIPA|nr:hypothetical protein PRIPAC_91215 [Pristionchus pacificus]|eukprot:PDM82521.1 hypothetical protein PRIPAC_36914 [Pristionchus pacificus]